MTESARFRRIVIDAMMHDRLMPLEDEAVAARVMAEAARVLRPYRHGRREVPRSEELPPVNPRSRAALLDEIMAHSYAAEELRLSVSRLALAAWHLGFGRVTAFAAWLAYRTFPQLGREWRCRGNS